MPGAKERVSVSLTPDNELSGIVRLTPENVFVTGSAWLTMGNNRHAGKKVEASSFIGFMFFGFSIIG